MEFIDEQFDNNLVPTLIEFVKIPSLSVLYDPQWETNTLLQQAMEIQINFIKSLDIAGFTYQIQKEQGKPWLFYGNVPATDPSKPTTLIYGHFDKQPHFTGWKEGTGPVDPVILQNRLYGRGSVDDGYAMLASSLAIKAIQHAGHSHGRFILIGENEQESGSSYLMYYMEKLKPKIGNPDQLICLDSGIENYDQMWLTSSLRGCCITDFKISILDNAEHSGVASGVVPDTFRILRLITERFQDSRTGQILIDELHAKIPTDVYEAAAQTADSLGTSFLDGYSLKQGVSPISDDLVELLITRTWKPTLVITGIEGIPNLSNAGNVIRPQTSVRFSIRLPPCIDYGKAKQAIVREIERDPPYGAKVQILKSTVMPGWYMNKLDETTKINLNNASLTHFGKPLALVGTGGSIPFIQMFSDLFPGALLIVTGVAHNESNMHAANENIDLPYLKKLIYCFFTFFSSQIIRQ